MNGALLSHMKGSYVYGAPLSHMNGDYVYAVTLSHDGNLTLGSWDYVYVVSLSHMVRMIGELRNSMERRCSRVKMKANCIEDDDSRSNNYIK